MSSETVTVPGAECGCPQLAHVARVLGLQGAQLTSLFDCLEGVHAWIKDRQGLYLWVNRAFLMSHAVNDEVPCAGLDQVLGKTDYDFSPPYLADQYRSDDEQVLTGHCIVDRVEMVQQRDGLAAWNVTNKIPLRAANGSVVGTAGLTRRLKEADTALAPVSNFGPVLGYLRGHFRETISNRQLAQLAGLSVRAFERKFHATFQVPPQKYLRKLRLRTASHALVFTQQSIIEVALSCGFADQSHFTREFHRHYGRTPRAYREWYAHPTAASATLSAGPSP